MNLGLFGVLCLQYLVHSSTLLLISVTGYLRFRRYYEIFPGHRDQTESLFKTHIIDEEQGELGSQPHHTT